MKRDDLSHMEAVVREANPVPRPSDLLDSNESAAVALLVSQGRRTMTTTLTPQRPRSEPTPTPSRRWAWAFAGALILTVVAVGLVALLRPDADPPVADQATTSLATTSTTSSPTTVVSPVPGTYDVIIVTDITVEYPARGNPGQFTAIGAAVDNGVICSSGDTIEYPENEWLGESPPAGYYQWETMFTCADGGRVFYIASYGEDVNRPDGWDSVGIWNNLAGTGSTPNLTAEGTQTGSCRNIEPDAEPMRCVNTYVGTMTLGEE